MRVVFMGTPDFAVPSLRKIVESDLELVGIVTRPDKPRGRGQKLQATEVKAAAQDLGLDVPVLQPESLKDQGFLADLKALDADLFGVVAFVILPRDVLAIPRLGSVNVHPSLLPKYRGAAPIQWAVIHGETETGVTIFRLSPRVDAGDVLIQERVAIGADETAGELYERLKEMGAELLVRAMDGVASGSVTPIPQSDEGVTRAPKLEKEDGRIDWAENAETIRNLIRGVNPFPGAFTMWQGQVLKVHRASVVDGLGESGKVLGVDGKIGLLVGAGKDVLLLDEIQPAGKKRMSGADFVRGYPVKVGEVLG
ncbi:MAG: methionyl-tRNA formyltransferase [Candidatus Latescibacterota bacterium]|jgi:methionyl-tRNA formyltransferase